MTDILLHAIIGLLGVDTPLYKPELDFWGTAYDEQRPRIISVDDVSLAID